MGNIGVVRAGSVLAHRVFERPVFRQASAVGDVQLIFVDTDLDGYAGLILLVLCEVNSYAKKVLVLSETRAFFFL